MYQAFRQGTDLHNNICGKPPRYVNRLKKIPGPLTYTAEGVSLIQIKL